MNRFSANFSSSPPSTPDSRSQPATINRRLFAENPSTTPAGPPSSSAASFTPAGPPPSSIFGSSQIGSGRNTSHSTQDYKAGAQFRTEEHHLPPRTANGTPARPKSRDKLVGLSQLGGRGQTSTFTRTNDSFERGSPSIDQEDEDEDDGPGSPDFAGFTGVDERPISRPGYTRTPFRTTLQSRPPKSVQLSSRKSPYRGLPRNGDQNIIPNTVRQTFLPPQKAPLEEADSVILNTEIVMRELSDKCRGIQHSSLIQDIVTRCAHELIKLWGSASEHVESGELGTMDSARLSTGFQKANYLASLLLALYHPPSKLDMTDRSQHAPGEDQAIIPSLMTDPLPLPQILLDWLENFHTSYYPLLGAVQASQPNCTAHNLYWDVVQSLALRGKLREVVALFAESDFKYAASAIDDGDQKPGYSGAQLQAVQSVINRARQVLDTCPGSREADWEVDDSDWDNFRRRVSSELDYLTSLGGVEDDEETFQAENFGILKSKSPSLVKSLRGVSNNVPATVVENLRVIYKIVLGSSEDIMASSQDWLEATTALTIWWDGSEDDNITAWSMDVSRSQGHHAIHNKFLTRLRAAFLCVTDPKSVDSFPIGNMLPTELGVAAIFQGDMEGVLLIVQSLSLTIASALVELGTTAGWLASTKDSMSVGFDQEDLIVLNYGASPKDGQKDEILSTYAHTLFHREHLQEDDDFVVEGWELSLSVASRMSDPELAKTTIAQFIENLELQDQDRMDKLVSICSSLGFEDQSRRVSEKFADHLVHTSTSYGLALIYYARSHNVGKIRQVIDLLNSYCLVQSQFYPQNDEMDLHLQAMVESPRVAFQGIRDADPEAAELLQFYFAGYACLRRFYLLRDEELQTARAKRKPAHRPIARKLMAAKALLAAVTSAADSIYGGLYDAERQSAIQVDCLLPLLGEATMFVANGDGQAVLSSDQIYALLAAIEDLQTVNTRVYEATEECLQASIRNFHGSLPPSPHAMLKKSVSSGTNSNFSFSLMGSEMLGKSGESSGGKSLGSMVLVDKNDAPRDRGWDWRSRFKDKGTTTGAAVLKFLRVELAKELSIATLEGR